MKVTVFPCGPAANESELKAVEHLKTRLQLAPGDGQWVLLTSNERMRNPKRSTNSTR